MMKTDDYQILDCRSEIGVTVGIVDSIITMFHLLSERDLSPYEVSESLKDLMSDEFVKQLTSDDNAGD